MSANTDTVRQAFKQCNALAGMHDLTGQLLMSLTCGLQKLSSRPCQPAGHRLNGVVSCGELLKMRLFRQLK